MPWKGPPWSGQGGAMPVDVPNPDRIPRSQRERAVLQVLHSAPGGQRARAEARRARGGGRTGARRWLGAELLGSAGRGGRGVRGSRGQSGGGGRMHRPGTPEGRGRTTTSTYRVPGSFATPGVATAFFCYPRLN